MNINGGIREVHLQLFAMPEINAVHLVDSVCVFGMCLSSSPVTEFFIQCGAV